MAKRSNDPLADYMRVRARQERAQRTTDRGNRISQLGGFLIMLVVWGFGLLFIVILIIAMLSN